MTHTKYTITILFEEGWPTSNVHPIGEWLRVSQISDIYWGLTSIQENITHFKMHSLEVKMTIEPHLTKITWLSQTHHGHCSKCRRTLNFESL